MEGSLTLSGHTAVGKAHSGRRKEDVERSVQVQSLQGLSNVGFWEESNTSGKGQADDTSTQWRAAIVDRRHRYTTHFSTL